MKTKPFSRTVILLSLVSLVTDISSEMLYPIMPLFLQAAGFNVFLIGLLEGITQVVIGISTGYFGELSDRFQKRLPFVRGGYFLSAVSKPLMAFSFSTVWIFVARISERVGKGLRTSPRDALLAEESTASQKGRVFGFHRSMDTLGAALGPAVALWYLSSHPGDYRSLFLLAFLPGIAGYFVTLFIREKKKLKAQFQRKNNFFSHFKYWKRSGKKYRLITGGLLVFAFFNSADSFLFLMVKEAGLSNRDLILSYIAYNIVFATFAFPAGWLADRFGMRNTFVVGLIFFVLTYFGFSQLNSVVWLFVLFIFYGIFSAFTDGISKAWISLNCAVEDSGTAFGFYKSTSSLMALFSGIVTGWLWMTFSPSIALLVSAGGTLLLIPFFLRFSPAKNDRSS